MVKFKQPIYRGDTGRDVKAVKRALYKLGHHAVNTHTSVAGGAYVRALKQFQVNHQLDSDGVYGPKTHALVAPHFDAYGVWLYKTAKLRDPNRQKRGEAVGFADAALKFAGRMVYVEYGIKNGQTRSSLFHRKPGDFLGAGCDCSQFDASILGAWCGIKGLTDQDDTGTLLEKGKPVNSPAPGVLIIAGDGTGVHSGMFTRKVNGVWMIVEMGDQAAPDQISEPNFVSYFRSRGVNTFRYRDFF